MIWSIRLALLSSMFFSSQMMLSLGQAATPWENVQLAENFIDSFLKAIARSSAFSTNQKDDLSSIRETLTEALEKFNISNTTSKIKFHALNMVFASAVTEITVAEGDVNTELKINGIQNALNSAFLQTTGVINTQFVNDITNLIYTLAHTTANGESTTSIIKAGNYKQRSLKPQEPFSSAEVLRTNGSVADIGLGTNQQRSSTVDSSLALNVPGGLQGSSIQNTSEQQIRRSPVSFSQGPSGSALQRLSPQVSFVQDQQRSDGYRTGVDTAAATGGGLEPEEQSPSRSGVNSLQQKGFGDSEQIGQVSTNQGKSGALSQTPGDDEPIASTKAASVRYGVDSATLGLQGASGVGGRRPGVQRQSIAENQRSGRSEKNAAASAAMNENEPGSDAKGPLRQNSSWSKEQEQSARGIPVAVDQRSETSKPSNFGFSAASSVSEEITGLKPFIGTGGHENKEPTGKESFRYSSRTDISTAPDSYITNTGTNYRQGKDDQKSTGKESQEEREMQANLISGQVPGNQGQYKTVYQKANRFDGEAPNVYAPGAAASASAGEYGSDSRARVPGGQALSGQRASDVGKQGLDTRRPYKAEIQSIRPKDYGKAESGYESRSGANSLQEPRGQGLSSNGSATDGHNNYELGRATAITAAAEGYGATETSRPTNISTPNGSSKVSLGVSSLESGSHTKPFSLSNTVNSIVSQISTAYPDLSYCNVLIQTLLEIISALVNLLGSCNIGQFNFGTSQ